MLYSCNKCGKKTSKFTAVKKYNIYDGKVTIQTKHYCSQCLENFNEKILRKIEADGKQK